MTTYLHRSNMQNVCLGSFPAAWLLLKFQVRLQNNICTVSDGETTHMQECTPMSRLIVHPVSIHLQDDDTSTLSWQLNKSSHFFFSLKDTILVQSRIWTSLSDLEHNKYSAILMKCKTSQSILYRTQFGLQLKLLSRASLGIFHI